MITVDKLEKYYDYKKSNEFHALKNVSLKIEDGELLAIVGSSGSGKSTLMHILGGIDTFQAGTVTVDGKDLKNMNALQLAAYRNKTIGIVLQDFALIDGISILENVCLPMRIGKHISRGEMKKRALEALKTVGMEELAGKSVNKLSGGQRQRVAIARAIVNDPKYVFADEPTGALDSANGRQVMELFKKMNEDGRTVVIITHDMNIASQCGRMITMKDGELE